MNRKQPFPERRGIPASVVTVMRLPALPVRVWARLTFYEKIERRPPLPLRLLLPRPIRAEDLRLEVGAESRCVYDQGFVVKRVTLVDAGRRCEFDVIAQELAIAGGLRLVGGRFALQEIEGGATRIEIETRYIGSLRPRFAWRPLEALACHAFHRHILESIGLSIEAEDAATVAVTRAPAASESPGAGSAA